MPSCPSRALRFGLAAFLSGALGCTSTESAGGRDAGDAGGSSDDGTTPISNPHDGGSRDANSPDADAGPAQPPATSCAPSAQIYGDLDPLWSTTLGLGDVNGIATDASKNIIVGGAAGGAMTIGTTTYPAPEPGGVNSPFLLKLDSNGKVLWHRTYTGPGNIDALGVDGAGNIFAAGTFDVAGQTPPTLDFGTGTLNGTFFVAKFDPDGVAQWAKAYQPYRSGTNSYSSTPALAVDPSGNTAVMDVGANPGAFGGVAMNAGDTGFLAGFDPSGALRYAKVFNGSSLGASLQFDLAGNLFVSGAFSGQLDLGAPLSAAPNTSAAFTAKLDPTGAVLWQVANATNGAGSATAATSAGAFIAGTFRGTAGIAPGVTAVRGGNDVFIGQLDETGHQVFDTTIPAVQQSIDALAADPSGGVIAVGRMGAAYVDFGGGVLGPPGLAVAKFDGTGKHVYSARFGADPYRGLDVDRGSVAVDGAENVIVATAFYGSIDMGTGVLLGAAPPTAYPAMMVVAKYAQQSGPPMAPRTACAPGVDGGLAPGARLLNARSSAEPSDLALAPDAVYWATGSEIMSQSFDGGAPEPLAIAQRNAVALALDSRSVYWANSGSAYANYPGAGPGHDGTIQSMGLDGGTPTVLATAQDSPGRVVVDDQAVYWTAGGTAMPDGGTSAGELLALPFDGGAPTTLATGLGAPEALAVHNGLIAFATATAGGTGATIATIPRAGGATPTNLATTDHYVGSIALDGTTVYWTDSSTSGVDTSIDNGRVRSVPLIGGSAATIGDNLAQPHGVVVLGSNLFWANGGSFSNAGAAGNGTILSLPVAGVAPMSLIGNREGVGAFAIDGAHLAWAEDLDSFAGVAGLMVLDR